MRPAAHATLLAGLLALAACGDAPDDKPPADGARLYVLANCTTCHGADGAGGMVGPPLRGLAQHWDRESLADYLADPRKRLESDARLKALSLNFSMHMPPATNFTPAQRLLIADHALALSAKAN